MLKEDISILIVDDDATFGNSLKSAFTRAGFKTLLFTKPDEALSATKKQPFQAAIIDCMLPIMNGRDLAKKLKEDASDPNLPVYLISGIYKDKNFVREALQITGALNFFTKPLDIAALLLLVEKQLEPLIENPLAPLEELFLRHELGYKERIKAVNSSEEIHAFDLPWVISLLLHPKINGHLNIVTADGGVCGVGFQKGNIVQVYNTSAMIRGFTDESGQIKTGILKD